MIIEEKTNALLGATAPVAQLVLPFEQRQKSRLLAMLNTGEEAALFMPRGTILRGGDWLKSKDGRVIQVVAAPERVMQVVCKDVLTLTRVAYHLGNRHVPLQVGDGWLRLESDHVLKDMLTGLGAQVEEVEAPFEPEAGAYGTNTGGQGSHSHGSSSAKIHDHYPEPLQQQPHSHSHPHDHTHEHDQ